MRDTDAFTHRDKKSRKASDADEATEPLKVEGKQVDDSRESLLSACYGSIGFFRNGIFRFVIG